MPCSAANEGSLSCVLRDGLGLTKPPFRPTLFSITHRYFEQSHLHGHHHVAKFSYNAG
jgi:hypothetical protein